MFSFLQTCLNINIINDSKLYQLNSGTLLIPHNTAFTINFYIGDCYLDDDGECRGWGGFAWSGNNLLWMRHEFSSNLTSMRSVAVHEMGHIFSLRHTFSRTDRSLNDDGAFVNGVPINSDLRELVNGSNSKTAGDEIEDTPADPNVYNFHKPQYDRCFHWNPDVVDLNGQEYSPPLHNFMAYGNAGCENHFTEGQYHRMRIEAESSDKTPLILQKEEKDMIVDGGYSIKSAYNADINTVDVSNNATLIINSFLEKNCGSILKINDIEIDKGSELIIRL